MEKNKKLRKYNFITKDNDRIVNEIKRLESFYHLRFKSFITFTFRKDPDKFKGVEFAGIKKVIQKFMVEHDNACLLLCYEDSPKNKHFHVATTGVLSIKELRKVWRFGFIKYDYVRIHENVVSYILRKMTKINEKHFKLYYNIYQMDKLKMIHYEDIELRKTYV